MNLHCSRTTEKEKAHFLMGFLLSWILWDFKMVEAAGIE